MNPVFNAQLNDVRLVGGIGGPYSGFGVLPGLGFGRPGIGMGGSGFGLPFITGIAAGGLLTPRRPARYPAYPYRYPVYPYPQYPYLPYPYPPFPY